MTLSRRDLLKHTATLSAAGALSSLPLASALAQAATKSVTLASMGPVTGNWDPTSHTTVGQANFEFFIFSKLTDAPMMGEDPGALKPDLALSWEVVDETTLEFKLRDGVTFHDGTPFTAEDVKATFEYGSQPSQPGSAWYPGPVDVEVIAPLTVQIKTAGYGYPASAFLLLSSFLPIMSAKDIATPGALEKRPNGTGPFVYDRTEGDRSYVKANDAYWGGRPAIDELIYAYVPDANTRVLGLLNGQYDIIERLEPEQYQALQKESGVATNRSASTENKYLHFRCNKPPFDDVRVRKAAAHAIDRSQILAIMGEAGEDTACFISPKKFGFANLPNYPEYNPELAKQLLAEAGYPGGEGLPELEYITSTGFYPKTKEYGELISIMMAEVGFNVKLSVLEPAAWEQAIYRGADGQGAGHMCDVGWLTGSPEPDIVLRPNFHSSAALINGINDPEIDAVLDKERNTADPAERMKVLQTETLPMLAEKLPSLSLFSAVNFHGMSDKLSGAYFYPNGPVDLRKADLG